MKRLQKKPPKKAKKKSAKKPPKPSRGLEDSAILKRSADVIARRNPDGAVAILRLENDQFFYNLVGISADFWELIDGKASVSAIMAKLIRRHSPPMERFRRDVTKLVRDLRREQLIS